MQTQWAVTDRRATHRTLLLSLAPALALLTLALGGQTWQLARSILPQGKPFGSLSRRGAEAIARDLGGRLTDGRSVAIRDAGQLSAYSLRRGATVREWNVTCDTADGLYLFRINADTGRIFGVNRLAAKADFDEIGPLKRPQAEARAHQYLALVGVSSQSLQQLGRGAGENNKRVALAAGSSLWNFTYRRQVPGYGNRLLKVSVNGATGQLETVWNPVYAL